MNNPDLPQSFEWRGTRWNRCLGTSYFPARGEPHVGLRRQSDCTVWYVEAEGAWRASLVPSVDCEARRSQPATPGTTPQEALDGEVLCWLMTAFKLPGARELLAEVAQLALGAG